MRRAVFLLLIALAACSSSLGGSENPTPTPVTPVKLLATVFVSPTPNAGEREATRLAQPAPTSTPVPTQIPPPTVYVGTFLGAGAPDGSDGQ